LFVPVRAAQFLIVHLAPAETLDPLFGTGGRLTFSLSGTYERAEDVAVKADGHIVVAGSLDVQPGDGEILLRCGLVGMPNPRGPGVAGLVIVRHALGQVYEGALRVHGGIWHPTGAQRRHFAQPRCRIAV
jgi:hypothetical protein